MKGGTIGSFNRQSRKRALLPKLRIRPSDSSSGTLRGPNGALDDPMPEIPDLEHTLRGLKEGVLGRRITSATVREPIVLRVAVEGRFEERVAGAQIEQVGRRGHFVGFELGALSLWIHPMLAGRFQVERAGARLPASCCFLFALEDGQELRYLDDKRMGKAYLVAAGRTDQVVGLDQLGLDVLSKGFTFAAFEKLWRARRDQVRNFLLDKSAINSLGNAYVDEVLWEARIHPKAWCKQLEAEELRALHEAIPRVLKAAIAEVARRNGPIEEKVRDFLAVRGRHGDPCRRCGTTIREVRVNSADACFCPTCQPATRTLFIDWGKAPKPQAEASEPSEAPAAPAPTPQPLQKRPRRTKRS